MQAPARRQHPGILHPTGPQAGLWLSSKQKLLYKDEMDRALKTINTLGLEVWLSDKYMLGRHETLGSIANIKGEKMLSGAPDLT